MRASISLEQNTRARYPKGMLLKSLLPAECEAALETPNRSALYRPCDRDSISIHPGASSARAGRDGAGGGAEPPDQDCTYPKSGGVWR
eukprot:gene13740-biopygen11092